CPKLRSIHLAAHSQPDHVGPRLRRVERHTGNRPTQALLFLEHRMKPLLNFYSACSHLADHVNCIAISSPATNDKLDTSLTSPIRASSFRRAKPPGTPTALRSSPLSEPAFPTPPS